MLIDARLQVVVLAGVTKKIEEVMRFELKCELEFQLKRDVRNLRAKNELLPKKEEKMQSCGGKGSVSVSRP